jgi:uroporphyrinogen decarboxylase
MMNSIERFYATIERRPVDRPAAWLGMPDVKSLEGLFSEFGVDSIHDLNLAIGDDFYAVNVPFQSSYSNAIYAAFNWYGYDLISDENRTLTSDGCFSKCETVEELAFFTWPDAKVCVAGEECRNRIAKIPREKACLAVLWAAHFQDTCAAFGMETALMHMLENPDVFDAVNTRVLEFYLQAAEIMYKAADGRIHAVLIGNDFGSQRGLMLSPELIRRFVIPGCRRLVEQAHNYGIKVIYHSCGGISEIIDDLIACGVDAIHPIQALAAGMDAKSLKESFGGKVSFCGGVDTQELLVNGTPEQVKKAVRELRRLFPTGLIISPSHEAILPDVSPGNIRALFEAARE